jgi:hypothetical protein
MCTVYSVCILYVSACVSSFACGVFYYYLSMSVFCVLLCECVCVCNLSVSVSGTVLLVKQGWPQASGAAGALEGSYDLTMDAGSEGRQYQASAAAFSKYDPMYYTHSHTNTDPICMHTDIHTRLYAHTDVCTHMLHTLAWLGYIQCWTGFLSCWEMG